MNGTSRRRPDGSFCRGEVHESKPGLMQPAWPQLAISANNPLISKHFIEAAKAARQMLYNDE
jgi:hypothetical protein